MTPDELDALARNLHHEWESPELLPRIAAAAQSRPRPHRFVFWAAAAAAVIALGLYMLPKAARPVAPVSANAPLLDEQALAEVEAAEAAYRKSIDRLARIAAPKLNTANSPLMLAYTEKLALLDSAIGALRGEIDRNGFNTNLRLQMAALYLDKQQTLEQVLHHE
ncbi:MAG: hypothetical protein HYX27_01735 [Acidobacteria bacterium]|nr:hypothetical protein [Acidobacteriota bacterium]